MIQTLRDKKRQDAFEQRGERRSLVPEPVVETVNDVRFVLLRAREALAEVPSFQSLLRTTPWLQEASGRLEAVVAHKHLQEPCTGHLTCAFIGSSGHGKTTILHEMFPGLSRRGWLVTDVTDTTAQALVIRHAPPGSPEADEVVVRSWNAEEIKELMGHDDVVAQNERDGIRVTWLADGVEVDGARATLPPEDRALFRFPHTIELRPFPDAYAVPKALASERKFIRALTVKEQSTAIGAEPVLSVEGRSYHALQLRALVKEVALADPYDRIAELSGCSEEAISGLTFVDTPGLAVNGSVKDEILRHFLEQKSNHVALQLWKNDDLDIVVHLALCGRQSDFAVLWKTIERECGPTEMADLADRLILAVNGMNVYFTNRDLRAKYEDAETAAREGDQFATTIEDNILEKMSPRGRLRPARTCFLDSKSIVETLTGNAYDEAYRKYRPLMEAWAEPGGVGHDTLERLGLLESFRENVGALADSEDCGQGFLIRQIVELVDERGPALVLRKHLIKTGLLDAVRELREVLLRCYDTDGGMNREAVQAALKGCLSFLDPDDLSTLEAFAAEELDPRLETLVPERTPPGAAATWVADAFQVACALVRERIEARSDAPPEVVAEFVRYFAAQVPGWAERWGYQAAKLVPPELGFANTRDLITHCLAIHCREILWELLSEEGEGSEARFEQSREDREQMRDVLRMLEEGALMGESICREHGVSS